MKNATRFLAIWAAAIAGGVAFLAYAVIWYVIPIHRRLTTDPVDDET